jgi:hypothetical protein
MVRTDLDLFRDVLRMKKAELSVKSRGLDSIAIDAA